MINKEIERKFIVVPKEVPIKESKNIVKITQGYVAISPNNVRGRLIEHLCPKRLTVIKTEAFITIKTEWVPGSITRKELEIPVLPRYAKGAMSFAKSVLTKTRYSIPNGKYMWEVDIYPDKAVGVAEIELPSENTVFNIPKWIGKEVTEDKEFWDKFL